MKHYCRHNKLVEDCEDCGTAATEKAHFGDTTATADAVVEAYSWQRKAEEIYLLHRKLKELSDENYLLKRKLESKPEKKEEAQDDELDVIRRLSDAYKTIEK